MSYYQLKIITSQNKSIYKYDLSKETIICEYLTDYLNKEVFFVDGFKLHFDSISQFKIVETNEPINEEIAKVKRQYHSIGIVAALNETTIVDNHNYSKDVTNDFMNIYKTLHNSPSKNSKTQISTLTNKVFVVHGHDTTMLLKVETFLRTLDLEPIILFKEPDKGNTIIEKIEEYSESVGFAIVLYSKCDVGYPAGEPNKAKPRARQNVVFEHGYMMSCLSRSNVCALIESDDIETPGDIDGVVYIPYDENDYWQVKLAKNMKAVGLKVDLNKL